MPQRIGIPQRGGVALEPIEERLAVILPRRGKNRRSIANEVKKSAQLWVIFASHDPEDINDFSHKLEDLNRDCLAAEPGTAPILMTGLSTLGRFFPTKRERFV